MVLVELSPLGAARERPVLCGVCRVKTWNWSARCDEHLYDSPLDPPGELHPCGSCGRPTIEEPCSSCSNADEETK